MRDPALLVFAKQPVPGQAKTRLLTDYTPERSAEIAEVLIRETVELAAGSWPGPIYLSGAPDARHPLFLELADRFDVPLLDQVPGDLGARMSAALDFGIARHGGAAVLGCDVPHCRWDVLDDAYGLLARGQSVIGPTDDGGYYLIGLTQPHPELFAGVDWGRPGVLDQTLERAHAIGLDLEWLARLRDIDTPSDLWLVGRDYEPLKRFL